MRYGQVLEEIEPKHKVWNPSTLEYEFVGPPVDPTANYKITDIDSTEGNSYFGYINQDGAWYIMNLTSTTARYVKGDDHFSDAWIGRGGLNYDYFNNIF